MSGTRLVAFWRMSASSSSHALALGEQGDGGGGFDDNQLCLGVVCFGFSTVACSVMVGSLGLKRPAVCGLVGYCWALELFLALAGDLL